MLWPHLECQPSQQPCFDSDGQVEVLQSLGLELQIPQLHIAPPYTDLQSLSIQAIYILAQILVQVVCNLDGSASVLC